ncbi:MAG: hypothetical protein V3R99_06570, partial [Thermoguttaceae bacterium]
MKMVLAVTVIVLLSCSTAAADWGYGVPVAVPGSAVHSYYSGGHYSVSPYYGYPGPVVTVSPHVVYRRSFVVAPAPVVVAPHVIYRAPVVIRPRVYVPGQPIRNAIRAARPY